MTRIVYVIPQRLLNQKRHKKTVGYLLLKTCHGFHATRGCYAINRMNYLL